MRAIARCWSALLPTLRRRSPSWAAERKTGLQSEKCRGPGTMGKRRAPRLPEQLNVRIFGLDQGGKPFSIPVQTLDVSHTGARIRGAGKLTTGETIGMEVNGKKGRFLV